MNGFDFLIELLDFARQDVMNFIVSITMISLVGIFLVACINSISNFRLFNIEKNKELPRVLNSTPTESEANNKVYDMLIKAWEKRKKDKGSE